MFTGIISHLGSISASRTDNEGTRRLSIDLGPLAAESQIGDSIAVCGVCLTIVEISGNDCAFDVSGETVNKTCIGDWDTGRVVNLESALTFGDKLGGHMVSGHVDGVGQLVQRRADGDYENFTFQLPSDEIVKVVEKGSLSIDGISLTTFDCSTEQCTVALIPHTLAVTNLGTMKIGQSVHMEQDLVGRWIERLLP